MRRDEGKRRDRLTEEKRREEGIGEKERMIYLFELIFFVFTVFLLTL